MTPQRPLGLGTHIFVPDADAAVAFYSQAFGAADSFATDYLTAECSLWNSPWGPTSFCSARRSPS
jgi:uncharacterized glyoxalase superfamily protein PhnB